jgi:hypothetical protein
MGNSANQRRMLNFFALSAILNSRPSTKVIALISMKVSLNPYVFAVPPSALDETVKWFLDNYHNARTGKQGA